MFENIKYLTKIYFRSDKGRKNNILKHIKIENSPIKWTVTSCTDIYIDMCHTPLPDVHCNYLRVKYRSFKRK